MEMLDAAKREGGQFDIVHQHGIWTGISIVTNTLRKHHGMPTLVAPHGTLEPTALAKSWWKKRLAGWMYEDRNLFEASCIHATASSEVIEFRNHGIQQAIALATNGISDTWLESVGDCDRFRARFQLPADQRFALFMSRIAPKKNLPSLLAAWATTLQEHPEWALLVVGGDEDGHEVEVKALVRQLGLETCVHFLGPLFGQEKRDAFSASELFILPSLSEGFPMVVLDALGAGVPAIVTYASAWQDLHTHGCGWWVEPSPPGLASALNAAMSLAPSALREMGKAARHLVATQYNWATLSVQFLDLYRWLRKGGQAPPFVSTF
jgi:glycosyltransferase involved in cell wall biosynthesis